MQIQWHALYISFQGVTNLARFEAVYSCGLTMIRDVPYVGWLDRESDVECFQSV